MSDGELPADEIRALLHRAADLAADYLENVETYPVLSAAGPGDISRALPVDPPEDPEALDDILADFRDLVLPGLTHWNHPGFMAYFGISGSAPGIAAELLSATVNVNAMLWRTSPAATELEERVCDWLRSMAGLPPAFRGHINDTASMASFLSLAAARDRVDPDIRRAGQSALGERGALTVYTSDQAHSSIDKAAIGLGLGLDNVRRLPTDAEYRMRPQALAEAIRDDRRAGRRPVAVVATAGTTATTSVDPIDEIATLSQRESIWLHVDAAYAGSAALCPEMRQLFAGWERADSIVINPHKWLFTPFDCSVLLLRRPEDFVRAFSVVPEYLRTPDEGVTNLMDLGIQLGRRFRALKLWMVIRAYGVEGLRRRLREHCRLATELAERVASVPAFELVCRPRFSVVCLRLSDDDPEREAALNEALVERVNAAGSVFLSATRLDGRAMVRVAFGNIRTGRRQLEEVWRLLCAAARELGGEW
jgi:aromatic-L-amino-acid decarboxylase